MLGVVDTVVAGLLCQIWRHSLELRGGISWAVFCMSLSAASLIHWYRRPYLWFFLLTVMLLAAMQPFCYKPSPYVTSFPNTAKTIPGRQWNSFMMISCLSYAIPAVVALWYNHHTYAFSLLGNTIAAWQYHRSKELVFYNLDNIFATFTMLLAVYTVWLAAPRELLFAPPTEVYAQCTECPAFFYFMLVGVPFAGAVLGATGDNAFLQYLLEPSMAAAARAEAKPTKPSKGQPAAARAEAKPTKPSKGQPAAATGALLLPPIFNSQAPQPAFVRGLLWICGGRVALDPVMPSPTMSSDTNADTDSDTDTDSKLPMMKAFPRASVIPASAMKQLVYTSTNLPPLGSLLWGCQCHRVSNSIYETLHPWWHVASILGPLFSLAYLVYACTEQVPDMGMDKSLAFGGMLELPLVSSVILTMCILGVFLENYSGAKPPI